MEYHRYTENTAPVIIQPIKPPIKPSNVLLGLMDGTIYILPNARPAKYAKVSLVHVVNNTSQRSNCSPAM